MVFVPAVSKKAAYIILFDVYNHRFSNSNRLDENELEDKIWENADSLINMTKLHKKVGGDKKRCFDKINDMVRTSRLKSVEEGKEIKIVRIDTVHQAEFEHVLAYQLNMLEAYRREFDKFKKPMFYTDESVIHTEPPLPMDESKIGQRIFVDWKKYKIVEEIPIWKTKRKAVTEYLEKMRLHHKAVFGFISKTNLQRSLGFIRVLVAETRIKKCEDAIDYHFEKLLSNNPEDVHAIRQFYQFKDQL